MAQVRTVLLFMMGFSFLGVLLVSWAGPPYISWDNTAGDGTSAMCLCSTQALQGAQKMIAYQMRGALVGAILGLISGVTFVVLRRKKPEPPAAAA